MKIAICAANRISLQIQPRSLLIFSLARKKYNTSGPVRYIPKNYTQFGKSQKEPSSETFEKKEEILRRSIGFKYKKGASHELHIINDREYKKFKSSYIFEQFEELQDFEDANYVLEVMDIDVRSKPEFTFDLDSDINKDGNAESDDLLSHNLRQDAEKLAIELLAARAYTELELQKKLSGKKYPTATVESVITDLRCRGLLNDGLYAESFSRSKWLSLSWGPRRIKQALKQKGVKEEEAEKATKQVFEGDDAENENKTMQHGMSKLSMDHLFVQASKQWFRGSNTSLENRKARIVRWLQYRGFNWGVTTNILKKLQDQYPH